MPMPLLWKRKNKLHIFQGKTKQSATQNQAVAGRYNCTLRVDLIQVEATTIRRKYQRECGQDDDNRCNDLTKNVTLDTAEDLKGCFS